MDYIQTGKLAGTGFLTVLALMLFIVILRKIHIRRKTAREIRQAAEKQMREEALNRMILNERSLISERNASYDPYEISYESRSPVSAVNAGRLMVSLEEKNELSTKKFVLNPVRGIRIGSGQQGNDVVVQGDGIAEYQCELFSENGKVFIRSKNKTSPTILQRRKQRVIVNGSGLRVLTGDRVLIGKVIYTVTLIGT